MFDSNQMNELRHVAADRDQRAGGGGACAVYNTSKAYFDARGYAEMSPYRKAMVEMLHRYQQACEIAKASYAWECRSDLQDIYGGFE